jgi:LacI family transcriptional regulator
VHPSTVSRALRRAASGKGRVTEADSRIAEIAQRLGYVPNPNAASLTTKSSQAIGVLVPQLTDIVLSRIYDAIEGAANRAGFETFVANTHDDAVAQRRRIALLLGRNVDGLIFGDARLDSHHLEELASRGAPLVLTSRRYPGLLSSTCDDVAGGRLAGDHLAGLGHTRIGIVSGPEWASTGVDRRDGCVRALAGHGIEPSPDLIRMDGFDVEDGREAAEALLDLPKPPTAIFAANDYAAIGVLGALRRRGLQPGRDVAVVGYNDIPICSELTVPLTSIRSAHDEMGKRAVEILLALIHGLPVSSATLQPELVVRETTVPGAS